MLSFSPYSLEIISQHKDFKNKTFKQYDLEGLPSIGVWKDEPFEIVFKNNSFQKIQVRISLDGTDILTGNTADLLPTGDMWVVNACSSLTLKAFPETNKGGSQFLFTTADKSVAAHTHGDMSSRSIIAAAVFVESDYTFKFPYTINNPGYPGIDITTPFPYTSPYIYPNTGITTKPIGTNIPVWTDNTGTFHNRYSNVIVSSNGIVNNSTNPAGSNDCFSAEMDYMETLPGVGAGERVDQNIEKTAGLTQPTLAQIVKVRYMWWNELKDALRASNISPTIGSGFPKDEARLMSIGSTPRKGNWTPPPFAQPEYARF